MNKKILISTFVALAIFIIALYFYFSDDSIFVAKGGDSPFGFHPGDANNYTYMQDIGAKWSREGTYIVWDWVDQNRDGGFSFKKAEAPPKSGNVFSGKEINYDEDELNAPEDINLVINFCPFRNGGEFLSEREKDTYVEFVEAMVERYDGDDDLGCVKSSPDCYVDGDREYPSQELSEKMKKNPIKYWQVCNQLMNTCEDNCKNTFAGKYAEVMKLSYQAVKSSDEAAQVLIAGDSSRTEYPAVFSLLKGNYIDIIDKHFFGSENAYMRIKLDLDFLKNSLEDSGFDIDKLKFWITETGTYSGDPIGGEGGGQGLPYQTEKQQASGLIKRYVYSLSNGIEKIFWAWGIVEGFGCDCCEFDYTGLIYDGNKESNTNNCEKNDPFDLGEGVKKLAYYSYKMMVEKLDGSSWESVMKIKEEDNGVHVYKFNKGDRDVWVVWNDGFNQREVRLDVEGVDLVKITEAVPNKKAGRDVNYNTDFDVTVREVDNNQVLLRVGGTPLFVEEN